MQKSNSGEGLDFVLEACVCVEQSGAEGFSFSLPKPFVPRSMTFVGIQQLGVRVLRPVNRPATFKRCCFRSRPAATADMSTLSKTDVVEGKKNDMQGKNIIVTGANSGIGLALSKALVSRGAHVTVAARDNAKGAECALCMARIVQTLKFCCCMLKMSATLA